MATVHPEVLQLSNNNNHNNSTFFVGAEKQIISESKPLGLFI